jgi:hypothetical protein
MMTNVRTFMTQLSLIGGTTDTTIAGGCEEFVEKGGREVEGSMKDEE